MEKSIKFLTTDPSEIIIVTTNLDHLLIEGQEEFAGKKCLISISFDEFIMMIGDWIKAKSRYIEGNWAVAGVGYAEFNIKDIISFTKDDDGIVIMIYEGEYVRVEVEHG